MWGALSDERTGLSFSIAVGSRQDIHFRVQLPWDSWPYFTISDPRLRFCSPPTTRRATVEVFDPASIRQSDLTWFHESTPFFITFREPCRSHLLRGFYSAVYVEWRTFHGAWDVSLRAEPHLHVTLAAVYWSHSADSKYHLHSMLRYWATYIL
jgi:hypothetical protein